MKKHKRSILASRIMITSAGFICLIFLAAIVWSSGASSSQTQGGISKQIDSRLEEKEIKVQNRTNSFKVVGLEKNGQDVKLNLRNDYDKSITAFAISPINHRYLVRVDLIDSDEIIIPHSSYTKELTLPDSQVKETIIIIRSVVFQDGTSDGDLEISERILDNRLGERTQMQRVAELLDKTLKSPNAKLPMELNSLKARIKDLPTDSEPGVSAYFRGGLHSAKENAMRYIESIEFRQSQDGNNDLSQELREMKSKYYARIAKRTD